MLFLSNQVVAPVAADAVVARPKDVGGGDAAAVKTTYMRDADFILFPSFHFETLKFTRN